MITTNKKRDSKKKINESLEALKYSIFDEITGIFFENKFSLNYTCSMAEGSLSQYIDIFNKYISIHKKKHSLEELKKLHYVCLKHFVQSFFKEDSTQIVLFNVITGDLDESLCSQFLKIFKRPKISYQGNSNAKQVDVYFITRDQVNNLK